jgi:hypothetical protein
MSSTGLLAACLIFLDHFGRDAPRLGELVAVEHGRVVNIPQVGIGFSLIGVAETVGVGRRARPEAEAEIEM